MIRLALALTLVSLVACSDDAPRPASIPQGEAVKILESTPWLDSAPQDEADIFHAYIFPRGEGLYFTGNSYKGSYELFRYFVEDDTIKLRFLDEGKTYTTRFTINRWEGEVFDYKLTLHDAPRGPTEYFGFSSATHDRLPAPVRKIAAFRK